MQTKLSLLYNIQKWTGISFLSTSYFLKQHLGPAQKSLNRNAWHAQKLFDMLNIRVHWNNAPPDGRFVVVSNHCSWLDPLAVSMRIPIRFITSTDVKKHWFLGPITQAAQCLYVSRNPLKTKTEIEHIGHNWQDGHLGFYPEGTSTDHTHVLPFKTGLFELCAQLNIPILPVVIQWNHPAVPYYGDMTFFRHLQGLIQSDGIEATIQCLDPIDSYQKNRKQLAQESFHRIQKHQVLLEESTY